MPTAKTDRADNTFAADKPAPGDARRAGVPALKALKPKVPNLPEGAAVHHQRHRAHGHPEQLHGLEGAAGSVEIRQEILDRVRPSFGRVEDRFSPALPHQTVHAVFPHTAFRCSSCPGMRRAPTRNRG